MIRMQTLTCACGHEFTIRKAEYTQRLKTKRRAGGLFCSRLCYYKSRAPTFPSGSVTTLLCVQCGQEFALPSYKYAQRIKQLTNPESGLYCSGACRSTGVNALRPPKRHPGVSDLEYEWEVILTRAGLSMGRGLRAWLIYGHQETISMRR